MNRRRERHVVQCHPADAAVQPIARGDLSWLVGILEGEGCFRCDKRRVPQIILGMTDADVVRRAGRLFGRRVYGPYVRGLGKTRPWKPMYVTRVVGEAAVLWMRRLAPYLGERRRARVDEILTQRDDLPTRRFRHGTWKRWHAEHTAPASSTRPSPSQRKPRVAQPGALLSVKQAAERLNVSQRTIRRLVARGALHHTFVGTDGTRLLRFEETDLDDFHRGRRK